MAQTKSASEQTVVETHSDGTTVVHHHIREWQPHATEDLRQIEATIDAWDRRPTSAPVSSAPPRDHAAIAAQVDRITRRVKATRKETVTETVTEWVEGPVGSGPINVEEPAPALDDVRPARLVETRPRPKRRFAWFEAKDKSAAKPADKEYQPQCSALTDDGAQCRNSSRHGSKYCISHFGYQPPTTKGLAQRIEGEAWDPNDKLTDRQSVASVDTRPAVRRAPDTRLRTRKPSSKTSRRQGRKKR